MALTGLEIYKNLPRTNCGDCNFPTCMAFAMQLAAKKTSLDQCPHVSEEAKTVLAEASAPPMRLVRIGKNGNALEIGQETVLFRHQEKFHHPAGVAVILKDSLTDEELNKEIEEINSLKFMRVGEEIGINLIAIEHSSTQPQEYARLVEKIRNKSNFPLILIAPEVKVMQSALEANSQENAILYAANKDNYKEMAALAKKYKCPLCVEAEKLEEMADLTGEIKKIGLEDLILSVRSAKTIDILQNLTCLRRLALEKKFRPLGYPTLVFTDEERPFQEVAQAATYICKYGSIVVVEGRKKWQILPMLTVRQNIYTDPQVPNAVEAKLYEIGQVSSDSPVIVTTNFSLTYFTVEGEVASSKIPTYISVVETEGLGVLNAYAGDKWSPEKIGKTLEAQKVKDKITHNSVIIPGLVAVFRAELEDDFGWKVLVGPEEAARIPAFLRKEWKAG